jgi:AcrR family transcriptional regulator
MKPAARVKAPTRHRYTPENAYSRGQRTRTRLIGAGLELFGQRGFAGASTRDIAAAAGLNAPALQYYFNNKEGLYFACAEYVVSQAWSAVQDPVVSAERLLARKADDGSLIEAFCAIQFQLADFLNGASGNWLQWMARDDFDREPRSGWRRILRRIRRVMRVKAAIIGRLLGREAADVENCIRDMSLTGQLLCFHLVRQSALSAPGLRDLDAGRLALIRRITREHTIASLRAMISMRAAGPRRGRQR